MSHKSMFHSNADEQRPDEMGQTMSNQQLEKQNGVRTGEDPTKAILSESALNKKYLCDYVINVATGCRHGCKFCYVPSTPNIRARPDMLEEKANVKNSQREWGSYVLYRDGLGERLNNHLDRKRTWKETEKGCGIVGISFATDCYMDGRAGDITRNVVKALTSHGKYARVLTRNPILALQDLDIFLEAGERVTIGSSIPCMDADQVTAIEPSAPAPAHRLRGLQKFNEYGVQTYVSMSPTYPTQDREDLRKHLECIATCNPAVIFHEPINPRGGNFEMTIEAAREAGELNLAYQLEQLQNVENWVDYAISHFATVQQVGDDLGLPIHLWPDQELIRRTEGEINEWITAWYERQSPEEFAERDTIDKPMPEIPRSLV